jgi:dipeptidyl-peptidase-4
VAVLLRAAILLAALAPAPLLPGEGGQLLTPERLAADPPLGGVLPSDLAWHPDAKRLTYLRPRGKESAADLVGLDAGTGREALILAGGRALVPPTGKSNGGSGSALPLAGYTWSPQGEALLVSHEGGLYLVDAGTAAVRTLTRTPEAAEFPEFSPDGKRVAFVRKNDLYMVEVGSGRETRLTMSGSDTLLNGRLDWVYEEELASRSGRSFFWSPDSRAIAYLQLDQARVPTFPIVDFLPVRNEVRTQRYPKAGAPNAIARVGVVALSPDGSPGPERLLSFDPDDCYVLPDLAWAPDSRTLAYQHLNREQNELQLRFLPVPDSPRAPLGGARTVLTERAPTWVDALGPPRFLKDGHRFLWLSQREGFAHIYLCEAEGPCRALTTGPWVVDKLLGVDERAGHVYFTATEKDPRERQLYRVGVDGTGRTRLSGEDGTHKVLLSPGARFYADTWSDVATPPRIWVASPEGGRRSSVEENRNPEIARYELGGVEWVEVKAPGGIPLHARLLKPARFDPRHRYPVLVKVYGGPHVQTVLNAWGSVSPLEHLLASHGFLVWSLDNRGSAGRGQAFADPIFHGMGGVELEDQLAGVEYLKSLPYVDPARLGIWGWSYGGYLTLYALTHAPAVFKAGVAGAPVTDWKFYDTIYTERYMGTPQSNPKGYEGSSPLFRAADLRADLLLIHGTADDNVHLANTISFIDALTRAGRPYRLSLYPRQMHGFRARESRVASDTDILRHFESSLKP